MVHEVKNIETKLPRLRIHIRRVGWLSGLAGVAVLIYAFDAPVSIIIGIYLIYRILKLVMRVFGLVMSLVFTLLSIIILFGIITFLI